MSTNSEPRDILSGKPFHNKALDYHRAGWFPIPLKPKLKNPQQGGYTGRKNAFPDDELAQVIEWRDTVPEKCNVGIWLRDGIIGIDVDAYTSASDNKIHNGAKTLADLEARLGPLPSTWTSTARSDGISGIRFFQVPANLEWSGKAGEGIDIIQRVHRFAAVYPSYHPQGTYRWYPPEAPLDGNPTYGLQRQSEHISAGYRHTFVEASEAVIPKPEWMAVLPDPWVEFLTKGYTEASDVEMDMDLTPDEIMNWAKKTFARPAKVRSLDRMCSGFQKTVKYWKAQIDDDASSHDKVRDAHWQIFAMGIEGHKGWLTASEQIEKYWKANVKERNKRGFTESSVEMFRSRTNALRKFKGKVDKAAEDGVNLASPSCRCFKEGELGPDSSKPAPKPTGRATDPTEYRFNDDGNAEHLHDLYGTDLIWVDVLQQWMFWNGDRWIRDADGIARRCYWKVRDRQEAAVNQLWEVVRGIAPDDPDLTRVKEQAKTFQQLARSSGTNRGANAALDACKTIEGVTLPAKKLDENTNLLAVENGMLDFSGDNPGSLVFRKAAHDDYVTLNTNTKYMEPAEWQNVGGDLFKGRQLWMDYLDQFLPDMEMRLFVQKLMGYCMYGDNHEKLAVFLWGDTGSGKSTLLEGIMSALGDYADTVDMSIFKEKPGGGPNPSLISAMPRRIITASEVSSDNHMHADLFKRITGMDRVSSEVKYSMEVVTRIPAFTPVIATNNPPTIKSNDNALKRRLLVVPFSDPVSAKDDKSEARMLIQKLSREYILTWLVEGWRMYARDGLKPETWPKRILAATADFSSQLNDIGEFLRENVEEKPIDKEKTLGEQAVPFRAVFDAYQQWCIRIGMKSNDIYNATMFGKLMSGLGWKPKVVKIEGHANKAYLGMELLKTGPVVKFQVQK